MQTGAAIGGSIGGVVGTVFGGIVGGGSGAAAGTLVVPGFGTISVGAIGVAYVASIALPSKLPSYDFRMIELNFSDYGHNIYCCQPHLNHSTDQIAVVEIARKKGDSIVPFTIRSFWLSATTSPLPYLNFWCRFFVPQ